MMRLARAWGALAPEQRLAAVAALALLVTMFFPWYELQSLNRKTGTIASHSISAFGDVSFVEAAVFLVAAGVIALLFARSERREFHMPGSDGAVVMIAGGWATLLIFYRVFSRPAGHGYPVGIQWGFFLAFVAAGALTYAGWRMRASSAPEPPLVRTRRQRTPASEDVTVVAPTSPLIERPTHPPNGGHEPSTSPDPVVSQATGIPSGTNPSPPSPQSSPSSSPPAPAPQAGSTARKRPRFPPTPSEQLSFEDPPPQRDRH